MKQISAALMLFCLTACQPASEPGSNSDVQDPQQPAASTPEDEPSAKPLNLSTELLDDVDTTVEVGEDTDLLPDLFDDEQTKKVKLSGGLLTDEEAVTIEDRIEGAEVKVEVKTR